MFCDTDENDEILTNCEKIIDEIKDQVLLKTENTFFMMGKSFTRFRFKTNDRLPYNQKINVAVCVISLSTLLQEKGRYYPQVYLQDCFYDNCDCFND